MITRKRPWYLQTWLIGLLFALWFLYGVPAVIGIILLILQFRWDKKLFAKYGEIDNLESLAASMRNNIANIQNHIANLSASYEENKAKEISSFEEMKRKLSNEFQESNAKEISNFEEMKRKLFNEFQTYEENIESQKRNLNEEISEIQTELKALKTEVLIDNYNFSDYDGLTSEECKNKLAMLKTIQQQMIQEDQAIKTLTFGDKRAIANDLKQVLRCFNAECDNVLLNLGVKNIDASRAKIQRSFDTLNKIFATDGIVINNKFMESKLAELNLVYTYELKREQEREQQKAIKEQMLEEEKVRREIEREKAKIEKDQSQVSGEISRMMKYLEKTQSDAEKELYIDKIRELETRLKELEANKETVLEREANAKAGFVYVISNIGSFGEDVYKIGMTRRLEPMDRIKELSSASVPFEFDVHAMIFCNDAPYLENLLHSHFEKNSVNKVNPRKEFFKVKLEDIAHHVKENFNNTAEFTYTALAKQYYQSLEIAQAQ
jgi:hypothetical protein